jgi:hypothetical protein
VIISDEDYSVIGADRFREDNPLLWPIQVNEHEGEVWQQQ